MRMFQRGCLSAVAGLALVSARPAIAVAQTATSSEVNSLARHGKGIPILGWLYGSLFLLVPLLVICYLISLLRGISRDVRVIRQKFVEAEDEAPGSVW